MSATVQSIFQTFWPAVYPALCYLPSFSFKVINSILMCRTHYLGSHAFTCDNPDCAHIVWKHNSCRNRHCPNCQAKQRAQWLEKQLHRLLPVRYFHFVFTLPSQLRPIVNRNRRVCFSLLFKAASSTIIKLAADPRRLNGKAGAILMLHTWTQRLLFHPHIHGIVPGGVLSNNAQRWQSVKGKYLLPRNVVTTLFKRMYLSLLKEAFAKGKIKYETGSFQSIIASMYERKWNVHIESSFKSPVQVVKYLAAYSNRVAISDRRIVSVSDKAIKYNWLDRQGSLGSQWKTEVISGAEFIKRFTLHILPKAMPKIRYYGILSNRNVKYDLAHCAELIRKQKPASVHFFCIAVNDAILQNVCSKSEYRCEMCGDGTMQISLWNPSIINVFEKAVHD